MPAMGRSFEELVAEASAAPMDGWDFSWLDGRATEERPSWGYQRLLGARLAASSQSLDLQTGGGEVLAGALEGATGGIRVATEGWPPNRGRAAARLGPLGVDVVAAASEGPLPFRCDTFDLVTSRHPATVVWSEIARVLAPGGTYLAQHVGGGTNAELREHFLRPRDAGAVDFDVGAVVWFLRKVVWTVPGFTVDAHLDRLRALHDVIEGFEARKPS
jgi:SAM-dependent methyltransferase